MQSYPTGPDKVIQCGSRALTKAESNWAAIEVECLAIQWAIQHCSFYLKGIQAFEVITDHHPLLGTFAKPLSQIDNPRLVRLREKIIGYSFTVSWIPGRLNEMVDTLSRSQIS